MDPLMINPHSAPAQGPQLSTEVAACRETSPALAHEPPQAVLRRPELRAQLELQVQAAAGHLKGHQGIAAATCQESVGLTKRSGFHTASGSCGS